MSRKKEWTFEECRALGLQAGTRMIFNRTYKSAYTAARENGWLDEIFGAGRAHSAYRNSASADFRTERPPFETQRQRVAWQNKVCSRLQKELYREFRPGRQCIIVVEPRPSKTGERFTAELSMLRITVKEAEEFEKIANSVFEKFDPGTIFVGI